MGFVFLTLVALMVVVSLIDKRGQEKVHGIEIESSMFRTSQSFTVGMVLVLGIIAALYMLFW
jgi:SSS family solute:Na+ symporter